MLREFLPETLVLPRNALGRNGNPVGDPLPRSPGMLLTMNPTVDVPLRTEDSNIPKARWRQVQYLSNLFWTRWSKEY